MKTFIKLTLALFSITALAQSNCSKYYSFEEGGITEYKMQNSKGKVTGSMTTTVEGVNKAGESSTATLKSEIFDKKGKSVIVTNYNMTCDGSTVIMDFKSLMNADMLKQFDNLETEITGTNVDLPNELSEGQNLPDAGVKIKIKMLGMNMNMVTNITNRKVVGNETITTPAGTFDCVVISQLSSGKMMIKFSSNQKFWLAEGVGLVKSEDYNDKGKLQSSTILTSFSK